MQDRIASADDSRASDLALPSSFRDPAGFVFRRDGILYRQVNSPGGADYDRLMSSGLYDELVAADLLIPHVTVENTGLPESEKFLHLQPELIPFLSYPYEWCFGQLKDAALATLAIQKRALAREMSLKDASAYNIQFRRGKAVLIDTLSLEIYQEGQPWAAYRQFCEHFLATLALMAYSDARLGQLLRIHLDGVPLSLAAKLLPWSSRFKPGLFTHLHLHAAAQRRFSTTTSPPGKADTGESGASESTTNVSPGRGMSKIALLGLVDNLESAVRALSWRPAGTEWGDYYANTNYATESLSEKERLVASALDAITPVPKLVWDLGANNGRFSRLAAARGAMTVAWDVDTAAVEQNWIACRKASDSVGAVLPLVQDLTNPSPSLGWAGRERMSLSERGPADLLMALALIHHLTITNNVPFGLVADFFSSICAVGGHLIIEFVPATDSQARRLLARRTSPVPGYDQASFEQAFARLFTILRSVPISGTERTMYVMQRSDVDS